MFCGRGHDCQGGDVLCCGGRDDLFTSMVPVYERLLHSGLDMLVYSGDVDGIVPVIGTRRWMTALGLPITQPWRTWHSTTGRPGCAWLACSLAVACIHAGAVLAPPNPATLCP